MGGRVSRRSAARDEGRSEVLLRAAEAIAQHGYHGMSMRDLAKATGRGLASFYRLFQSKEDILFELQHRAFQQLLASAERALEQGHDPADALHLFIANHVRYFVEQPAVMRVLVQEASALPPERRAVIRDLKQRYFGVGERLVRDVIGARGGSVAAGGALEVERSTYCLFGMLNWIYGWYEPSRHGSPDDLARTIFDTTLGGVIAACGSHPDADPVGRRLAELGRPALLELPRSGADAPMAQGWTR
jgi:AcrR family transcriptional regulator